MARWLKWPEVHWPGYWLGQESQTVLNTGVTVTLRDPQPPPILFLNGQFSLLRTGFLPVYAAPVPEEVELAIVTMVFDASDPDRLLSVLAKYVVLSRGQDGCRNIDLCASATKPGRFVIVQKWESPEAQRVHFDSPEMVEMARACDGLLVAPPQIDLLEAISAHDLF